VGENASTPESPKIDPEVLFQLLAAEARAGRRSTSTKRNLFVATIVALLVVVGGLVAGAEYLQHLANGLPTNQNASAVESNLNTALSSARSFVNSDGGDLSAITSPAGLAAMASTNSLKYSFVSRAAGEIAVGLPDEGALVLAGYAGQTGSSYCLGILDVVVVQASPVFADYPETQAIGTYYFEAPPRAGACSAATITPPTGGQYVSGVGFPTAALP
jgi:hypothetical protein